MIKRKNRVYTDEFRQETVVLVTEQGYTVIEAAASLGITSKLIYNGKTKLEMEKSGQSFQCR